MDKATTLTYLLAQIEAEVNRMTAQKGRWDEVHPRHLYPDYLQGQLDMARSLKREAEQFAARTG